MAEPEERARGRGLALAIVAGLTMCTAALVWWLAYYSQYDDWFQHLDVKAPCIVTTVEVCRTMQKPLATSAIPVYQPILFWAGLLVFAFGVVQQCSRGRD